MNKIKKDSFPYPFTYSQTLVY